VRRGLILLEVLLSLALFVMTSLALLSIVSDAVDGLRRSRDRLLAADHARGAISMIEAGLARPETLNGPVVPSAAEATDDPGFIGVDPGDAPQGSFVSVAEWALEIETEQTEWPGLTLVAVRAYRIDPEGFEIEGESSFTLRQIVRVAGGAGESGVGR